LSSNEQLAIGGGGRQASRLAVPTTSETAAWAAARSARVFAARWWRR